MAYIKQKCKTIFAWNWSFFYVNDSKGYLYKHIFGHLSFYIFVKKLKDKKSGKTFVLASIWYPDYALL